MDEVLFSVSPNSIIALAALFAAIFALVKYFKKGVNWVDDMNDLNNKISKLEKKHDTDIKGIRDEQTLLVYGVLQCLKCFNEQGNYPNVREAIDKIEKHINSEAHR